MKIKRFTKLAILTAVALIIHIVESLIPLPLPVPGVKLGFANIITLILLFLPSRETPEKLPPVTDALFVLFCRVLLGSFFSMTPVSLVYSLTGGVFGVAVQILLRRFISHRQIWACSALGAVFHNIGQILAAVIVTGTPALFAYLPVLIITGIITGIFTGIVAQFVVVRLKTA